MIKLRITSKDFAVVFILILWMLACYMLPNKFPLRSPLIIPETPIDQITTYSTPWIWVYVSYYIYIFGIYLILNEQKSKTKLIYSYTSAAATSSLIFFAFPTTIQRAPPPPLNTSELSDWAFHFIRSADSNLNCLPSMHIAISVLATLILKDESKKWGAIGIFWTLLICYSTLAIKQHYFLDVLTGAAFGLLFWFLTNKFLERQTKEIS